MTSFDKLCTCHPIAAALLSQVDDQAQQRLQGLTELYNVAGDAKTQHMLLRQAIAYAIKANLANLLGPVIKVDGCMYLQLAYMLCVYICVYPAYMHAVCMCSYCLEGCMYIQLVYMLLVRAPVLSTHAHFQGWYSSTILRIAIPFMALQTLMRQ